MNWKKFLKPNKQKIIILIILSFLIPYPYVMFPIAWGISPAVYFFLLIFWGLLARNVLIFIIFTLFALIPFFLNYIFACLLYKYLKLRGAFLVIILLVLLFSIFPLYKNVTEHAGTKKYTFIEQFTEPIKDWLRRKKFEKFDQEGDIVKLINIKEENFIESKGYYVLEVLFEGRETEFKFYTTLCTKNRSWIKENSCYKYKPEKEMESDFKFNINPKGGRCYVGILEEASCE